MPRTAADLAEPELDFLTERHLATLTTLRADGSPHVVAIAFSYDQARGLVRIISSDDTQKVRNVERDPRAVVSQVDGPRWLTLEGTARVRRDEESVRIAVTAFEARYRPVRENPQRVAIEIQVERVVGRA
jgi:PPOX class probable F420-dependent enzyme